MLAITVLTAITKCASRPTFPPHQLPKAFSSHSMQLLSSLFTFPTPYSETASLFLFSSPILLLFLLWCPCFLLLLYNPVSSSSHTLQLLCTFSTLHPVLKLPSSPILQTFSWLYFWVDKYSATQQNRLLPWVDYNLKCNTEEGDSIQEFCLLFYRRYWEICYYWLYDI